MYVIFFHVSGLALLEILFYFLYIGPMETKVFKNTIKHSIKDSINYLNHDISLFNTTTINNLIQFRDVAKAEENKRTDNNIKLFHSSLQYWSIIISFSIFFCIIENGFYYLKKEKPTEIRFEMTNIQLHNHYDETESRNSIISESINESIINRLRNKEYRKKIYISIFNNILLACLILSFEYWFFNYIILKYKIISTPEIHYLFVESIQS